MFLFCFALLVDFFLDQATDPINEEDRWDCIQGFYELVNQESDGPQVALRLLAHKIQSPQEKESLQALTVLEACMNNCGKRFHAEAAKFRFLNELIKILTPKYFGAWSPQKVKDRVTEVLYGWTLWLKDEPKIQEAYSMLKKQGIVEKDPKLPDKVVMAPLPQRHSESVFDQEDKSKLLSRLLKSARPEDLETANRLIKNTVREEQEKAEKVSKRESTLKEVESSAKQLRELLERHRDSGTSLQHRDDLKAVYERCDRLRPSLFRLASDTVDDDGALAQILAANDELTLAVNAYKERVGRGEQNGGGARSRGEEALSQDIGRLPFVLPMSPRGIKSYHLIDLSALDSPQTHRSADSPSAFQSSSPDCSSQSESQPVISVPSYSVRSFLLKIFSHITAVKKCNTAQHCLCLKSSVVVFFWRPAGQLEPITLYDRDGIRVSLHFARDCPPGHPGVAVVVMSAVNTSALHVKGLTFQAAVPKSMLVKLQPASGTDLPPYNPLLPPPAISQVLLLANPHSCSVRLRYKLTLTHGEQRLDETGDVSRFPDWSSLIGLRAAK
uniref:ADP-ribosylation factor-binding protein GGA3-like n=1 Tax=Salarias fasciatus TaxID=181472 RepID=A0A672GC23_SALFA